MAKRRFPWYTRILQVIEAIFLLPFLYILSIVVPYKCVFDFSKQVGRILLLLSPNKKNQIRENLKKIHPNKEYTDQELNDISAIISGYELRIILEMIHISRMSFHECMRYIRISDPSMFAHFVHDDEGYIFVTSHSGNWELYASYLSHLKGQALACLVERQFNPFLDRYINYLRTKMKFLPIYNEISTMKPLFRYIKNGGSIALVADQTHWFSPLFLPFFGELAATPKGVAQLALKFKKKIVFVYSRHLGDGVYDLQIELLPMYATDSAEELLLQIYKKYEEKISEDPQNWFTLGTDRWGLTPEKLAEWEKNPDSDQF